MNWTCPRKGNLIKETKSLKCNTKQNNKYQNRILTILNRITSLGYVGKRWNGLLYSKHKTSIKVGSSRWRVWSSKKLKFDHTAKWNVQKQESAIDNKTHKLIRDFKILSYLLNLARRPDLLLIDNKNIFFIWWILLLLRITKWKW